MTPIGGRSRLKLRKLQSEYLLDLEDAVVAVKDEKGAYPDAGTTPFRGEKGSPFEGGWRVLGIMWWPNHIAAGAQFNEMMSHIDACLIF